MEDSLFHNETLMAPDRPCQDCSTIGVNTVCLKQLKDARQPSCLGHILRLPQDGKLHKRRKIVWHHYSKSLEVWSADCSRDDLLQRARDGCHLCGAFLQADWGESVAEDYHKIDLRVLKHQYSPQSPPTYELSFGHVQGGFEPAPEIVASDSVVTKSTGSRKSLRRLKDLLEACHEHQVCEKRWRWQNRRRRLPTRLVDLRMVAQIGTISITEGENIPATTTYMTLSHCWGPEQPSPDTPWLNYKNLREGFPLYSLPPTFRDACLAVLDLDCHFVWIDALCILQGDGTDWLRESTRMSDIFAMSALTIAGSDSNAVHAGLFRHRENLNLSQIRVNFRCSCTEVMLAGFNSDMGYWCRPGSIELPLHNRAWVIQEMALSTRVAYFTKTGVYWVCEEIEAGELRQSKRQMDYTLAVPASIKPNAPFDSNSWINLIHEYSESKLSFDKDRLAALAGLARRCYIGSRGQLGKYYAGLWEFHLHEHLTWQRAGSFEKKMTRRASTYPAPSWSWASINAPVMWESISLSPACFEVLEADMKTVLDPYGVVNGGRLRLRARLVSFEIHIDVNEEILTSEANDTYVCNEAGEQIWVTQDQLATGIEVFVKTLGLADSQTHRPDSIPQHQTSTSPGTAPNPITAKSKLRGGIATLFLDEPARITSPSPFHSIPKFVMQINNAENTWPYGLLVEPVHAQRGTYRRVGLVHFFMHGDVYKGWVKRVGLSISEEHYLHEGPDGRHVIDLI